MGTFNSKVYTLKNIQIFKNLGTKKRLQHLTVFPLYLTLLFTHFYHSKVKIKSEECRGETPSSTMLRANRCEHSHCQMKIYDLADSDTVLTFGCLWAFAFSVSVLANILTEIKK